MPKVVVSTPVGMEKKVYAEIAKGMALNAMDNKELARKTGLSTRCIQNYRAGVEGVKGMKLENFLMICKVLGIKIILQHECE